LRLLPTLNNNWKGFAALPFFTGVDMPKFKYTGDEDFIIVRDVKFLKGKAVEVPDDLLAAKIGALDYFTEVRRAKDANAE
jgi:hypothetical protein